MQVTAKVIRVINRGKDRTLYFDSDRVKSITVSTNPPAGHEIEVGDTVNVHFAPDGRKVGVARHPRSQAKRTG